MPVDVSLFIIIAYYGYEYELYYKYGNLISAIRHYISFDH